MVRMGRLSRLSPEEIAGGVLLALVLLLVALRPGPVTQLLESPFSTPAPGGGPARELVPPTPSPVTLDHPPVFRVS